MELNRGLDGLIFTETYLSAINGEQGKLSYCGYDLQEVVDSASYEEVTFLLWHQRLPNKGELAQHEQRLRLDRALPKPVWGIMHVLPERATPMEAFRTVASTLSMFDSTCDHGNGDVCLCRAVSLTAKFPTIIASFDRLRRDKPPIEPRPDLGHGANTLYMLTGEEPDAISAAALEKYFLLLADHGMNASTFSARVTASTLGDMYSAIVTALGTLKGPLHGGANEIAMDQLAEIGSPDNVSAWLERQMATGSRIMGFGHRVYKIEDPRATVLRQLSQQVAEQRGNTKWHEIAVTLEQQVLSQPFFQERKIFTNVDYYSAPLLYVLGVSPDQFTPFFAAARVAGWTAHILEQYQDNRLIRPRAFYAGAEERAWVSLEERPF